MFFAENDWESSSIVVPHDFYPENNDNSYIKYKLFKHEIQDIFHIKAYVH